nr:PREDICTED: LOW QUALITY PROTEIN: mannose-binding protein C-like [Pelecanus crispus]
MTLLQPSNALVLWLSLLIVISSVNTDKPERKIYSCPVIQCSAPVVNGLPGRDGRDGPKGEKGERGEGLRGLQGFSGKAGPLGIKGDLGPQGEKGECGIVVTDDLQREVTAWETKVQALEAELNRYKKGSISDQVKISCTLPAKETRCSQKHRAYTQLENYIKVSQDSLEALWGLLEEMVFFGCKLPDSLDTELCNVLVNLKHQLSRLESLLALNGKIRKVGEKILASNGKEVDFASALEFCEEAGGTLATPMNEEENEAILGIVKQYNRYVYLGIKEGEASGQSLY